MKVVFAIVVLFVSATAAFANEAPYPTLRPARGQFTAECLSSNRSGQRFLGRQFGFVAAQEEANYQCYTHSNEFEIRSCRVIACRLSGGAWRRIE
jgi:hypothetical protein